MKSIFILILSGIMLITGCAEKKNVNDINIENDIKTEIVENKNENTNTEINKEKLNIYYFDEELENIKCDEIEIDELDPHKLLEELSLHGVIPDTTIILSREEVVKGEDYIIIVNLSKDFEDYILNMGSAGESLIIKCLANTFIEAYGADGMYLQIEGNVLETGHNIYDTPLKMTN